EEAHLDAVDAPRLRGGRGRVGVDPRLGRFVQEGDHVLRVLLGDLERLDVGEPEAIHAVRVDPAHALAVAAHEVRRDVAAGVEGLGQAISPVLALVVFLEDGVEEPEAEALRHAESELADAEQVLAARAAPRRVAEEEPPLGGSPLPLRALVAVLALLIVALVVARLLELRVVHLLGLLVAALGAAESGLALGLDRVAGAGRPDDRDLEVALGVLDLPGAARVGLVLLGRARELLRAPRLDELAWPDRARFGRAR